VTGRESDALLIDKASQAARVTRFRWRRPTTRYDKRTDACSP
jgi:hypothetical protein